MLSSIVAVGNALIAGYPESNALVLVLVAITDVAVLEFDRHGNRLWRAAHTLLDCQHRATAALSAPDPTSARAAAAG